MEKRVASREYLAKLTPRQVITICDDPATQRTYVDWIRDIKKTGIITAKGSLFSLRTGYILGAGAPERNGYIVEHIYNLDATSS